MNSALGQVHESAGGVCERQVVASGRERRVERESPAAGDDRSLRLAVEERQIAQIVEGVRGLAVEHARQLVSASCVFVKTERLHHGAQGVVKRGRRRSEVDGAVGVPQRELRQPPVAPDACEAVVPGRVARVELHRGVVVSISGVQDATCSISLSDRTMCGGGWRLGQPEQIRREILIPALQGLLDGRLRDWLCARAQMAQLGHVVRQVGGGGFRLRRHLTCRGRKRRPPYGVGAGGAAAQERRRNNRQTLSQRDAHRLQSSWPMRAFRRTM